MLFTEKPPTRPTPPPIKKPDQHPVVDAGEPDKPTKEKIAERRRQNNVAYVKTEIAVREKPASRSEEQSLSKEKELVRLREKLRLLQEISNVSPPAETVATKPRMHRQKRRVI